MYTIVLGTEEEYGKRLVRYMEAHLDKTVRICSFTEPEEIVRWEEDGDLYVMEEDFYRYVREEFPDQFMSGEKEMIRISEEEVSGHFCRYHSPRELIGLIQERRRENSASMTETEGRGPWLTAVFSPVFEPELRRMIGTFMQEGDLCLGMEELGVPEPVSTRESGSQEGNMGDLCYYIRLREKEIARHVEELSGGSGYLPSPDWYFDLMELKESDYRWFFEELKQSGAYPHVYLGMGCSIFNHRDIWAQADRLIVISSREEMRRRNFCSRLHGAIQSGLCSFHGNCEMVYREDLLCEPI